MKIPVLLFSFAISFWAQSQTQFYIQGVAGDYAMASVQAFQDDLKKQYGQAGVDMKSVLQFPMSLQAEAGFDVVLPKEKSFMVGGFFNYAMTKGKLDYSDYSGEVTASQNLNRYALGTRVSKKLIKGFNVYAKMGYAYTTLNLEFTSTIDTNNSSFVDNQSISFHSHGFIFEPGANWTYNIKHLFFRAQAGFEINAQGKTVYDKNTSQYLMNNANQPVKIDWTGVRFGLGIGYTIN